MTKYRIVTGSNGRRYLQFQDFVTKKPWFRKPYEAEVWRYVPDEFYYVNFSSFNKSDCPTSAGIFVGVMYSSPGMEHVFLIPFTKRYPDIESYLEYLRSERVRYLAEEIAAKETPTTYL